MAALEILIMPVLNLSKEKILLLVPVLFIRVMKGNIFIIVFPLSSYSLYTTCVLRKTKALSPKMIMHLYCILVWEFVTYPYRILSCLHLDLDMWLVYKRKRKPKEG